MRLLAIQLKRIGDLILTAPALRAAKLARPGTHLTLALTEGTAGLLPALADWVDDALIYRKRSLNEDLWERLLRGGFDVCVDFTGRDRSALAALASRAPKRIAPRNVLRQRGFWRQFCYTDFVDASVRDQHTVDYYLSHLAPLGVAPPAAIGAPRLGSALRVPPVAAEAARAMLEKSGLEPGEFIAVHPGSARKEKYWLPQRWARVINFCQNELGIRCLLTGGQGDRFEQAHLARIQDELTIPCADLSGQLDLLALAAALAQAKLFLGVDSGPMHLAAVWQTPQIVLFGPTNPFHWRPRHPGCRVLCPGGDAPLAEADFQPHRAGRSLEGISTQAVIGCIREMLLPEQTFQAV